MLKQPQDCARITDRLSELQAAFFALPFDRQSALLESLESDGLGVRSYASEYLAELDELRSNDVRFSDLGSFEQWLRSKGYLK